MPHERGRYILVGDPAAVVRHAKVGYSAALDLHGYRGSPRVDGIFHKLLDHGGGPFDDLSRRDLIDCFLIQYLNICHPITTCS